MTTEEIKSEIKLTQTHIANMHEAYARYATMRNGEGKYGSTDSCLKEIAKLTNKLVELNLMLNQPETIKKQSNLPPQ